MPFSIISLPLELEGSSSTQELVKIRQHGTHRSLDVRCDVVTGYPTAYFRSKGYYPFNAVCEHTSGWAGYYYGYGHGIISTCGDESKYIFAGYIPGPGGDRLFIYGDSKIEQRPRDTEKTVYSILDGGTFETFSISSKGHCKGQIFYLKDSVSLPTPSEEHRGKLITIFGGANEADKTYQCLKSSTGVYSWIQIAIG